MEYTPNLLLFSEIYVHHGQCDWDGALELSEDAGEAEEVDGPVAIGTPGRRTLGATDQRKKRTMETCLLVRLWRTSTGRELTDRTWEALPRGRAISKQQN